MKFRKHFDYDTAKASDEAAIQPGDYGESMTIQSQAAEADINNLMDRYGITGKMPESVRVPEYGDFTGITDYQTALDAVAIAMDDFMKLPPKVRSRFENNPQLLMEFVSQDANRAEAIELGLVPRPAVVDPGVAPVPAL